MRGAVTRFAARDAGPVARIAGFMAHLRGNGFRLGIAETETALAALRTTGMSEAETRRALKSVCCGSAEDWARFDATFDSYWRNGGRVRTKAVPSNTAPAKATREAEGTATGGAGRTDAPDTGDDGDSDTGGEGPHVFCD